MTRPKDIAVAAGALWLALCGALWFGAKQAAPRPQPLPTRHPGSYRRVPDPLPAPLAVNPVPKPSPVPVRTARPTPPPTLPRILQTKTSQLRMKRGMFLEMTVEGPVTQQDIEGLIREHSRGYEMVQIQATPGKGQRASWWRWTAGTGYGAGLTQVF
jgi:hypothetical protein